MERNLTEGLQMKLKVFSFFLTVIENVLLHNINKAIDEHIVI